MRARFNRLVKVKEETVSRKPPRETNVFADCQLAERDEGVP
jgi:hypothetical protein